MQVCYFEVETMSVACATLTAWLHVAAEYVCDAYYGTPAIGVRVRNSIQNDLKFCQFIFRCANITNPTNYTSLSTKMQTAVRC
jgi:hypothetical protein